MTLDPAAAEMLRIAAAEGGCIVRVGRYVSCAAGHVALADRQEIEGLVDAGLLRRLVYLEGVYRLTPEGVRAVRSAAAA